MTEVGKIVFGPPSSEMNVVCAKHSVYGTGACPLCELEVLRARVQELEDILREIVNLDVESEFAVGHEQLAFERVRSLADGAFGGEEE